VESLGLSNHHVVYFQFVQLSKQPSLGLIRLSQSQFTSFGTLGRYALYRLRVVLTSSE
jgi:hypothetical protein